MGTTVKLRRTREAQSAPPHLYQLPSPSSFATPASTARLSAMPYYDRAVGTTSLTSASPTSSEAIALHGQKALTPIIAGSIAGTCVGVAWIIAAFVAIAKYRRKRRHYKKVGKPDPVQEASKGHAPFILPPDPAVVEGQHAPGERIVIEKRQTSFLHRKDKGKDKEEKEGESNHSNEKDSYSLHEISTDSQTRPTTPGEALAMGPSTKRAIGEATTNFTRDSTDVQREKEHVKQEDYADTNHVHDQ